jgi:hypothetical protein
MKFTTSMRSEEKVVNIDSPGANYCPNNGGASTTQSGQDWTDRARVVHDAGFKRLYRRPN